MRLEQSIMRNNRADLGAAIYIQGCKADRSSDAPCRATTLAEGQTSSLRLVDTAAEDNTARADGGLVYASIGATVHLQRAELRRNKADGSGGAVWLGGQSQARLPRAVIK